MGRYFFIPLIDLRLLFVLGTDELLDRSEGAGGDAHTLAVDANNLKVDVLTTSGSDVGVTAGVAEDGTLSAQLTNSGHKK
jgi:hypothetical protein